MPPVHPEIVNGHQFLMVPVEAGIFLMGSPDDDAEAYSWEKPRHSVQISAFHLGRFPVTQALWRAVAQAETSNDSGPSLDPEPSFFTGDQRPVERVSWDDVQVFLRKLNDLTKASRPKEHAYRLPTDAEWEYAARGGNKSQGYKYAGSNKLQEVGWFSDNSHGETKPVGLNAPNEWSIYDLSGNVWEWCADDWHDSYEAAPGDGSARVDDPERGADRVSRGGSWLRGARYCRPACRFGGPPDYRWNYIGFRLALSLQSVG